MKWAKIAPGEYVAGEFRVQRDPITRSWSLFDAEGFDRAFDTKRAAVAYVARMGATCRYCGHDVPAEYGPHHAIGCPRWEPSS